MARPNIVYMHSHDTGRYVQPYGFDVPTPHLQRFAEQGVLFRQAFCAGPTCSPSRAALVTGQAPHSCGMLGLAHRGWSLNDYGQHVIHTLKPHGYVTALAGVQHIDNLPAAPPGHRIGYDRLLSEERGTPAPSPDSAACDFLRAAPAQPFFLAVGFGETHRDFPEPGALDDPRYLRPPLPLPDTPQTRYDMACYRTLARRLDERMGRVLTALDEAGLAENTLVIITTDHGIAFPGMKCNLTDHGIGVMLMMRGAGGFDGGKVIDGMASQIDLFPTLCEVLGIDAPPHLQGRSLFPLVRDEALEVNRQIFSEVTYHASYEPQRCVRTARYKYIRRFDARPTPVLPNCDDSVSKDLWLAHGWRERPLDPEQLYDLVFDPHETANLASDPRHAAALTDLRARLDRWMRDTNDPLLRGPVPAGPDKRVTPADGLSPKDPVPGW